MRLLPFRLSRVMSEIGVFEDLTFPSSQILFLHNQPFLQALQFYLTMSKHVIDSVRLSPEEAKRARLGPDAWPRLTADCTAKWVTFKFGDVVEKMKYCYITLLNWCKALDSIAPQAYFVDHETIGITFKELPEGVDPKYFPLFYQQLESLGENLVKDDNVLFLMPWFHFMSVEKGMVLCDKVLNRAILGTWGTLSNTTTEFWEQQEALDQIIPLFFAASKCGTNSATTAAGIISEWEGDEVILSVVLSQLTTKNWNDLFCGAVWNDDVSTALVKVLDSFILTLKVKAELLSNPLLAHLAYTSVKNAMNR